MPSTRKLGVIAALFWLAASQAVLAEEYTCPSDPGFCYLDVLHDGCWDGSDLGPIDSLLAGAYNPGTPGSIVCPPSVKSIVAFTGIDWDTQPGGHVLLYGTKVEAKNDSDVRITAGGRILLQGQVKASKRMAILGDGDVTVDGSLSAPNRFWLPSLGLVSTNGNI